MGVVATWASRAQRSHHTLVQHGLGLLLCLAQAPGVAHAEDAGAPSVDGGADAGALADAGVLSDAGPIAPVADAGSDGGASDAGDSDASAETAACSCETNMGSGEREIHLCTGSFEREACSRFSCGSGTLRSEKCDRTSPVRLCCDMKSRDLYTYLYEDCTHPNCEAGFRAQCDDFAGEVLAGRCDSDDDDVEPDPELDESASCSVASTGERGGAGFAWSALALAFLIRRRGRLQPSRE